MAHPSSRPEAAPGGRPPASALALIGGVNDDDDERDRERGDDGSAGTPPIDEAAHRAMVEAMLSECPTDDDDEESSSSAADDDRSALYREWGAGTEEGEAEYDYCFSTRESVAGLLTFLSETAADLEDGGAKTVGGVDAFGNVSDGANGSGTGVIDIDGGTRPAALASNASQVQAGEGTNTSNTTAANNAGRDDDDDDEFTDINVTSDALYATDRTMQISRTNRLLFVHVPSAGGAAVERSSLFDDARAHHAVGGNYRVRDMIRGSAGRGLTGKDFVRFALVRHPCARFADAFEYMKAHGNDGDRAWAREHIGNGTMGEFAAHLEEGDGTAGDENHFRSMEHFLFLPNGKLGVDTLLCAERWDESMDRLAEAMGRPVPQGLYVSGEKNFPPDPTHETEDSRQDVCSLLDAKVRDSIERRYAIDYCVFGYQRGPNATAPEGCGDEPPEVYSRRYADCRSSST